MNNQTELFGTSHIILDSLAKTQEEAFIELAALAKKIGCTDDEEKLIAGFKKRELESSTGFEEGFAIPHARIASIKKPAVLLVRFKNAIDWKSMDGKPTKVAIALIVPASEAANIHLSLLSQVAVKLLDQDFRNKIKTEKSKKKITEILFSNVQPPTDIKRANSSTDSLETKKLILAITACATGIAHTFMAADKLRITGPKLGYRIKVETHGSEGIRNEFTAEEIAEAEVIIIASDIGIELNRFIGKQVYMCPVAKAIKEPEVVIEKALTEANIYEDKNSKTDAIFKTKTDKNSGQKMGVLKHLMTGVSYMVPVVILGGICIAFAVGLSKAIYGPTWNITDHPENFFYYLNALGGVAFQLMIAVLGGYIANSIAGRSAIAPAMVVSFLANTSDDFYLLPGINSKSDVVPTGFVGAIAFGLAIGYTVKWMNSWNVPKLLRPIMPIIIIPVSTGVIYGLFAMFVFGACVGWVMNKFSEWIKHTWGNTDNVSSIAIGLGFGILIGAMAGFDMGGPINKIAFLTCTGMINSQIYTPMGAMACAIPVAPLGMGFATVFYRKYFNEDMKALGGPAIFMGVIGISEGAIPFAINDPKKVIPCNVVCSAIAGGIGGVLGIADLVAQGGPIVAFIGAMGKGNGQNTALLGWGSAWQWTLVALVIMFGAGLINAFFYGTLLTISNKKNNRKNLVAHKKIAKKNNVKSAFAKVFNKK